MKSITIHGLSDELDNKIRVEAARYNTSLNKTIKRLLEKSLGINQSGKIDHSEDFGEFCGIWSLEDQKEFDIATQDFRKTDSRDWQ